MKLPSAKGDCKNLKSEEGCGYLKYPGRVHEAPILWYVCACLICLRACWPGMPHGLMIGLWMLSWRAHADPAVHAAEGWS
eukprot:1505577-Pleurochrysis_carterae.AAC.1